MRSRSQAAAVVALEDAIEREPVLRPALVEDYANARLREKALERGVDALVQPRHGFRCPIPHRYDSALVVDRMMAPGSTDDTGFAPGCVV
jgi:hypothetical protein